MATADFQNSTWTTVTGTKTSSHIQRDNDLIVVFAGLTGSTTQPGITDSQGGTYSLVTSALKNASADGLWCFIRDQLTVAGACTVTMTTDGLDTGGGFAWYAITGAVAPTGGSSAIVTNGSQNNQAAGTPSIALGPTVQPHHLLLGGVMCGLGTTTNTAPPTDWTEDVDRAYGTPATGLETAHRDSGETAQTIAWTAATPGEFCSLAVVIRGLPYVWTPAPKVSAVPGFNRLGPPIMVRQAPEAPAALVVADVINARSRSYSTNVGTVVGSVDMPTALKLPMIGIAGRMIVGPPVLRAQEPQDLTVLTVDVADPISSRSRSYSTAVGTVLVQGSANARSRPYATASGFRAVTEAPIAQPRILAAGFNRIGPPLVREQEPGALSVLPVVSPADQVNARSRNYATAVGTDVVQGASTTRSRSYATAVSTVFSAEAMPPPAHLPTVGIRGIVGPPVIRTQEQPSSTAVVTAIVTADVISSRSRARSTTATLVVQLASATARSRPYATLAAATLQAIPQIGAAAVRLLQSGIRVRGGPPVLRDQEPGPATVQPVVSPADQVNARSRNYATASATDVVQGAATARTRAYSTAASIVFSAEAMPPPARLPSAGIGVRGGPPVLRAQEPGALAAINFVQASATARSRPRSSAVPIVIQQASAAGRDRSRSQTAALVVVRASATGRDRPRATAASLVVVQGQAQARSRARATAISLVIQLAIEQILRIPRPGISRTGGPPVLRIQEQLTAIPSGSDFLVALLGVWDPELARTGIFEALIAKVAAHDPETAKGGAHEPVTAKAGVYDPTRT